MLLKPEINEEILNCVDSSLEIFGESVKEAIYFHVEKEFHLEKSKILEQPQIFSKALFSIFGEGARVIEVTIVQRIRQRFGLEIRPKMSFAEAIAYVHINSRKALSTTSKT